MVIVYLLVDSFLQFERSFLEARPCETHVHFIILYWLYCDYRTIRFLWFHIPSPAIISCFIFCISWKQHEGWCGRGQSMEEVWWLRPMGFAYRKGWAKVCKIFDDPGMEPQMNMFSQDFWNWFMNEFGFPPKLPERGCERSHKDWLISLLPGMSSGLERSTSRLSSPCWAISQQSCYAQEYLGIFLGPRFLFYPPRCQEPKASRCVLRLWWETEYHLFFSIFWSHVLWSWGVPDCYKPMIFKNGIRKPFPRPTKKVKAPAASCR